ncbi:MarR family winged helix-turn-helix transcriptional regulator [Paraburkholderia sp. EG286B]|uniref:MarR family winged helix-turn-helix transcriptional regulator n=1 Tax=Paraburkholderia sp. EG286B TaxID=3237011 RepID=UPI0034D23B58
MHHYTSASFSAVQNIGHQLARAGNLVTAEMDLALKDLRITSRQLGILLAMQHRSAATPVELAKMLSIDAGLMTRMLDKLEANDLLKRSRSTCDRRRVNLVLTERGHEVAAAVPEYAPKMLNGRLKRFTNAEFEELGRLLQKFIGE